MSIHLNPHYGPVNLSFLKNLLKYLNDMNLLKNFLDDDDDDDDDETVMSIN